MLELKYFDKISRYEKTERASGDDFPPFDVDRLGLDSAYKSAVRNYVRLFFLGALWLMRAVWPVYRYGRLVVVSRYEDVEAVLKNRQDFRVPFGPEMTAVTGGVNFALGMDGAEHDRQRAIMDRAMPAAQRARDLADILAGTRYFTEKLLEGSGGRIDVMRDLMGRVFTESANDYFGLELDDPNAFLDRSLAVSNLIFADPFGNPVSRQTALSGAVRLRYAVDRAIASAQRRFAESGPQDRTILDRLVAGAHASADPISDDEIRAIAIGTLTGLIPTNSLAAGKVLEELLRHPQYLKEAIELAAACEDPSKAGEQQANRARFRRIIIEAARLNPALFPGQWRYAPEDAHIGGRRVRGRSVLMVSTMSALRDRRVFERPNAFWPDRPDNERKAWLMFGRDSHVCLGNWVAMEQITEIFQILLAQPNIRLSSRQVGRLAYIGPFPRRLDMEFDTSRAPRQQTMITIQAPLRAGVNLAGVQDRIARLGNPATADSDIGRALTATQLVHFASLSAFYADPDEQGGGSDPRLVFELNVDGDAEPALKAIADAAGEYLADIFALTEDGAGPLYDVFLRQSVDLSYLPWDTTGLTFNGTPDCPVADIAIQHEVATVARGALDEYVKRRGNPGMRARSALQHVREAIRSHPDERLRDSLVRPSRRRLAISEWTGTGTTIGLSGFLASRAGSYFALLLPLLVLCQSAMIYGFVRPFSLIPQVVAFGSLAGVAVLLVAAASKTGFDDLIDCWKWVGRFLPYPFIALGLVTLVCLIVALAWFNVWAIEAVLTWLLPAMPPPVATGIGIVGGVALLRPQYLAGVSLIDNWQANLGRLRPAVIVVVVLACAAMLYHAVAEPDLARWPTYVQISQWLDTIWQQSFLVADFDRKAVGAALQIAGWGLFALAGGIASTAIGCALVIGIFLAILRYYEKRDAIDERPASLDKIQAVAALENAPGYAQNHIVAVTPLKEGGFRRLTLAIALWGIAQLVTYWYRPGFVLNMGTIHYARWFRLPGSDAMVFFSNYDGSWESYLEDFVTKAHKGQTAAWTNGKGFPATRFLVLDGAQDGPRFKRWVRRQQLPSLFWYSRFPHLTTDQIRNNALIHDGLMRAKTDTAAQAWLDCFGTMPRPDNTMEIDQIQSLVFAGFAKFKYMSCAAITLPADDRKAIHRWLERLQFDVAFGEQGGRDQPPTFVAFSASGLGKILGKAGSDDGGDELMSAFPPAFRLGMSRRSKVLRDAGASAPSQWRWADVADVAGETRPVDVMLLVYGASTADCRRRLEEYGGKLGDDCLLYVVDTQPTAKTAQAAEDGVMYEHFGFRDGISQPIIRSTRRAARDVDSPDLVEPGEMILGYRNNAGQLAPAVTLPAELDQGDDLASDVIGQGSRFPRFRTASPSLLRDFGRNGTFLAIRQIEQHVDAFQDFTCRQAETLNKEVKQLGALAGGPVDGDWVAAKMMGRRQDGRPLSHWIEAGAEGRPTEDGDNDFDFGMDDPQGLRCPFGAHIRRANPRGGMQPDDPLEVAITKRHRILRRGRPYASADGAEKGMMFVALCADIERQFEFLQQTWITSPAFQGLTDEPDPIVATTQQPGGNIFTIPTTAGPLTLRNVPNFVTVRGGGYFFAPSRAALRFLASMTR